MEVVHVRCAGLDVSKKDARVCVRVAGARRRKTVESLPRLLPGGQVKLHLRLLLCLDVLAEAELPPDLVDWLVKSANYSSSATPSGVSASPTLSNST